MLIPIAERAGRRYEATREDQRGPFQRDRDRILYASAFRRLTGITQIARAGESDVLHTRLEHTVKVAQVGRRLAEHIVTLRPTEAARIGIEPEVVEAGCLAHDLGHPPFGHLGETVLNDLVQQRGDADGFEGNAQSFRILTKLAVRFESCDGLDLTRATLAACVKYPWTRQPDDPYKGSKWGIYTTELDDYNFATMGLADGTRTPEADLMDWADDIAYSVHDLEDFHRFRLLPWTDILSKEGRERLVKRATRFKPTPTYAVRLRAAHRRLKKLLEGAVGDLLTDPYEGTREQRRAIRLVTSMMIGRYINATDLQISAQGSASIAIEPAARFEVDILKQISREYIISNPALQAQQRGQSRIVQELFQDLFEKDSEKYLPKRFSYMINSMNSRARCIADCISSLTEGEATALHARLRGLTSGYLTDPIVR